MSVIDSLVRATRRIFTDQGPEIARKAIVEAMPALKEQARAEMAQQLGQEMVRAFSGNNSMLSGAPAQYPGTTQSPHPLYGYDFATWYSTPYSPQRRPNSLIDVQTIRRFADQYDIARSCINHLKREVQAQKFSIVSRDTKDDSKGTKTDIADANYFFTKPGGLGEKNEGRRHYELKIFEDVLVLGCFASWKERTVGGKLIKILPIDGATIRPRMDVYGWPGPGEYWYEQWVMGVIVAAFFPEEIDYDGTWPTTNSPWFKSPIEWLVGSILSALKADEWNRAWLTDGTQPGQSITLPEDWTPDQCIQYVEWFNQMLQGDSLARQKLVFLPKGAKDSSKDSRKDMDFSSFETWLAKRTAAVYGVSLSSIGFDGEVYKVAQENSMAATSQFGAGALLDLRKEHYDGILADLGYPQLEILNGETAEESAIDRANRLIIATGGVPWMTPSQASQQDGGEPIEGGDEIFVSTLLKPLSQAMLPPEPVAPTDDAVPTGDELIAKPDKKKAAKDDLARWQKKALNSLQRSGKAQCTFESDSLGVNGVARIYSKLGFTTNASPAEVRAIFRAEAESLDSDEQEDDSPAKKKKKKLVVLLLKVVDEVPPTLRPLTEQLANGTLSIRQFSDEAVEQLKALHIRAATLGRIRATGTGNPSIATPEDIAIGTRNAESQRPFLEKMASQILNGDVSDDQLANRLKMYGQRTVGTANEGWKENLPKETLITWHDVKDKSECEDCVGLAENGPYTPETLPTTPGSGATLCLTLCRCWLETEGGERSFYDPLDEMP